jgi:protein-L-isoaspartate O-methyltransferase
VGSDIGGTARAPRNTLVTGSHRTGCVPPLPTTVIAKGLRPVKRHYVRMVHALRDLVTRVGLMKLLDTWAARSRRGTWVRSLLAIHDVRALVQLDTPWWTFESADAVAHHLAKKPGARVLEWGSGASTVWLSKRAAEVIAIEHDTGWADQVRPLVGDNVEILTVPPVAATSRDAIRSSKPGHDGLDFTAYVHAIDQLPGLFDLIVIDGRAREDCLPTALARLAEGGLLVFDNVDRRRYRKVINAEPDIDVRITRGLTPALPYPNRTALITRTSQT